MIHFYRGFSAENILVQSRPLLQHKVIELDDSNQITETLYPSKSLFLPNSVSSCRHRASTGMFRFLSSTILPSEIMLNLSDIPFKTILNTRTKLSRITLIRPTFWYLLHKRDLSTHCLMNRSNLDLPSTSPYLSYIGDLKWTHLPTRLDRARLHTNTFEKRCTSLPRIHTHISKDTLESQLKRLKDAPLEVIVKSIKTAVLDQRMIPSLFVHSFLLDKLKTRQNSHKKLTDFIYSRERKAIYPCDIYALIIFSFIEAECHGWATQLLYLMLENRRIPFPNHYTVDYLVQSLFKRAPFEAFKVIYHVFKLPRGDVKILIPEPWLADIEKSSIPYSKRKFSKRRLVLDRLSYKKIISYMAHQGFLKHTESILLSKHQPYESSEYEVNVLIMGYLTQDWPNMKRVMFFLDYLAYRGLQVNMGTFSKLLSYFGQTKDKESMAKVIVKMEGLGLKPDLLCYTIMARYSMFPVGVSSLENLLEHMINQNVYPDTFFFNTVIRRLSDQQKMDEAENWFHLLCKTLTPNKTTLTILMNGYIIHGDIESAERMASLFSEYNLVMNCVARTSLMNAYIHNDNLEMSLYWYGSMIGYSFKKGTHWYPLSCCQPDARATSMIISYLYHHHRDELRTLLDVLARNGTPISIDDHNLLTKSPLALPPQLIVSGRM